MKKILFTSFIISILFLSACHMSTPPNSSYKSKLHARIFFETNSVEIKDPLIIKQNARWLKAHPHEVIILEGHCDERGSRDFNQRLGDRRSRAVMSALIKEGVSEHQLIITSYGKTRPRQIGQPESNRRVEFKLR